MANMIPISTVTVGNGGIAAIEFNNIPQIYTDLNLLVSLRSNRTAVVDVAMFTINNNTSSGSWRELFGNGTSGPGSQNGSSEMRAGYSGHSSTGYDNVFGSASIYFSNYTASTNKVYSSDNVNEGNTAGIPYVSLIAGRWANTTPISSIKMTPLLGTLWTQYSSATLYGIRKY